MTTGFGAIGTLVLARFIDHFGSFRVLAAAYFLAGLFIAANTLHDVATNSGIPTETPQVLWLLFLVMVVHLVATAEALGCARV